MQLFATSRYCGVYIMREKVCFARSCFAVDLAAHIFASAGGCMRDVHCDYMYLYIAAPQDMESEEINISVRCCRIVMRRGSAINCDNCTLLRRFYLALCNLSL